MYSQTLPHLLGGVRTPALVIWGDDDRIVPLQRGPGLQGARCRDATLTVVAGVRPFRRDGKARRTSPSLTTDFVQSTDQPKEDCRHASDVFHRTADVGLRRARLGWTYGATALTFSNRHFDPVEGSRLYNEYLEEYILRRGMRRRRHHAERAPQRAVLHAGEDATCSPRSWRRSTKRVKIVHAGQSAAAGGKPGPAGGRAGDDRHDLEGPAGVRLRARRRAGAVGERRQPGLQPRALHRGARPDRRRPGPQPGPFRWEGTHYQHRVVNPWAVPLQKPYPRVWIPGVLSKETVIWTAQHRYPYIALNTSIEATKVIWELYDKAAAEVRLHRRPGEFRLPDPRARAGHRGKGDAERPAVHVDAGRVHRPGAIRCGPIRRAISRRPAGAASSNSRSAGRTTRAATRPSRSRSREHDDHRRHARSV